MERHDASSVADLATQVNDQPIVWFVGEDEQTPKDDERRWWLTYQCNGEFDECGGGSGSIERDHTWIRRGC